LCIFDLIVVCCYSILSSFNTDKYQKPLISYFTKIEAMKTSEDHLSLAKTVTSMRNEKLGVRSRILMVIVNGEFSGYLVNC